MMRNDKEVFAMKRTMAVLFVLAVGGSVAPRPTLAGYDTYLALGDSITFGVGSPQFTADGQHDGDRGYVATVADRLGVLNGGIRPGVVNLAVSGETTDSFLGNAAGWPNIEGPNALARNTTYATLGLPSNQFAAMAAEVQALQAGGHSVDFVTLTLGSNDLFALVNYAATNNVDPATLFPSALQNISNNLGTILFTLEKLAPNAQIDVLSSYNPLPTDPLYAAAIGALNQTLDLTTSAFAPNAHFINIADIFVGRETELTYVASTTDPGNVHPTPEGYRLIAGAIVTVPEPSSIVLVGLGATTLAYFGTRRRPLPKNVPA